MLWLQQKVVTSVLLPKGVSQQRCPCFSSPLYYRVSAPRRWMKVFIPNSDSRDLVGKEESRKVAASVKVEKALCHWTDTGLLYSISYGQFFLGDFQSGMVGFKSLSLKNLRLAVFHYQGMVGFVLSLSRVECVSLALVSRPKCVFFQWSFCLFVCFSLLDLVSEPKCFFHWLWIHGQSLCLSLALISGSVCFFGWLFYPTYRDS